MYTFLWTRYTCAYFSRWLNTVERLHSFSLCLPLSLTATFPSKYMTQVAFVIEKNHTNAFKFPNHSDEWKRCALLFPFLSDSHRFLNIVLCMFVVCYLATTFCCFFVVFFLWILVSLMRWYHKAMIWLLWMCRHIIYKVYCIHVVYLHRPQSDIETEQQAHIKQNKYTSSKFH